jgi:hypothetical protein
MIRSISLYKSTLEDSSKNYIAFFCVVFHFLAIFESLSYFSEISNSINENEKENCHTVPSTVGRLQWRTAVRSGGDPITGKEEGDVNEVRHNLGQLFEEEGGKGLTGQ